MISFFALLAALHISNAPVLALGNEIAGIVAGEVQKALNAEREKTAEQMKDLQNKLNDIQAQLENIEKALGLKATHPSKELKGIGREAQQNLGVFSNP